jgi:hypothetical protein
MPSDGEKVQGIAAAGRFDTTADSEEHARQLLARAMPDAVELAPAIPGLPYPGPPPGVLKWYQLHPPEPWVGNTRSHFKYADWTRGKKFRGGSWGHVEF